MGIALLSFLLADIVLYPQFYFRVYRTFVHSCVKQGQRSKMAIIVVGLVAPDSQHVIFID
jgi:hypothetical protein